MPYFFHCGLKRMAGFICLLTCHGLLAQVSVAGTIVDPDGAAVPDIGVVLKTLHGDTVSGGSANSDAAGRFQMTGIASGDYELTVPAKYGFAQYLAPVHVRPGMHDLNIRLSPLVVTQDVAVAPETSQVTLDPSGNRDQVSTSTGMLEKVPVFDQDYVGTLTPFLDQTGVASSGVSLI